MTGTTVLQVRGLYAGHREVSVVRDLTLTVEAGEIVRLLGPNGAGETTALDTVAGVPARTCWRAAAGPYAGGPRLVPRA